MSDPVPDLVVARFSAGLVLWLFCSSIFAVLSGCPGVLAGSCFGWNNEFLPDLLRDDWRGRLDGVCLKPSLVVHLLGSLLLGSLLAECLLHLFTVFGRH